MAIKRVRVEDLRPGMFIHDLACGWLDHTFLRSRFMVRHQGQIERIKAQGIRELDIDTSRGGDVPEAPTQAEVQQELQARLLDSGTDAPSLEQPRISRREEAPAARRILGEAVGVIGGLLQDARLGRQLEPAKARPLVKALRASVTRNPGALLSLSRIKQADTYTFQHSVSTCALLVAFCHALGMNAATVEEAGLGALLHDVGKMKIPDSILNKPGKLTAAELVIMRTHASLGPEILAEVPGLSPLVIQIAAEHHEQVSGGGYPRGLSGPEISELGRMTAIVDVYDAMTSDRIYHGRSEPTAVLKRLLEWSDVQLDRDLVQQFIRTLGIYPVGSLVRLASGHLAVVSDQGENLLRPRVRVIFDSSTGTALPPRDLDLATAGAEEIVDYEDPADWHLDPLAHLA